MKEKSNISDYLREKSVGERLWYKKYEYIPELDTEKK